MALPDYHKGSLNWITLLLFVQFIAASGETNFLRDIADLWNPKTIVFFPPAGDISSLPLSLFQDPPLEHVIVIQENPWNSSTCIGSGLFVTTFDPIFIMPILKLKCDILFLIPGSFSKLELLRPRLDSTLYSYTENQGNVSLFEHYSIKSGPTRTNYIGNWSDEKGLDVPIPSIWERRRDFSSLHLRTTVIQSEPFVMIHGNASRDGFLNVTGHFIDTFNALQDRLGFSYHVENTIDGKWGAVDSDGRWNGMVGMLVRNETDVCISSLSITQQRSTVIDYSQTIIQDILTVIAIKSSGHHINVWVYLEVFRKSAWFFMLVLFSALSFTFFMIQLLRLEQLHPDSEPFSFLNGLALVSVILFQRDYSLMKMKMTTRILFYITCTSSFLFFAYYTAVLTSSMTVQPEATPIASFRDIIGTDYQLTTIENSAMSDAILLSKAGTPLKTLYDTTMANNPKAFKENMLSEKIEALILENPKILFFTTAIQFQIRPFLQVQPLSLVDQLYDRQGFGLQKDSEFLDGFNFHLRHLKESGMFYKNRIKWISSSEIRKSNSQTEIVVLGYENLLFPFLILAFGCLGAGILVLVEITSAFITNMFPRRN